MKVNFLQQLRDINGELIRDEKGNVVDLQHFAVNALLAVFNDEQNLAGVEKVNRWQLALKIKNSNDDTEFSVEDVALVKKLIGKAYSAVVVGQAWAMLEGK